jgi:hypothetical protein
MPRDFRWLCYQANVDNKSKPLILSRCESPKLGNCDVERQLLYRQRLRVHLDAERVMEIRKSTNGN